jgi:NitT/TauT family transport system permease protein
VFPETVFPGPLAVLKGFAEECKSGRLFNDTVASLFRVTIGFTLAALLGIPFGLWFGSEKECE